MSTFANLSEPQRVRGKSTSQFNVNSVKNTRCGVPAEDRDVILPEELQKPYFNDFIRWCEECVMISDKITGLPVPFRLNAPQRRLAGIMEAQRRARKPVRVILLKARQWGGSTLVQAYMAWHQLVRDVGRNALVCAHVKDAAALIRSTYSLLLDNYPEAFKEPDAAMWKLKPYQQTQGTLWIPARDARLAITSANNPDSLRGASYHLAHLSEAAFWGDGNAKAASAIVRTVCGTVPATAGTVVVIESTADGPDNWFAREWRRAVAGKSDKVPVFVPWHEIELYRRELTPAERRSLPARLDEYELRLMAAGVELEALAWYHEKRREYSTHAEMMAEFPSTADEAFATSAASPFAGGVADVLATTPLPCAGTATKLIVAALGEKAVMTEFAVADGRIAALRDHVAGDAGHLMRMVAGRLAETGAQLAFVEAVPPDGRTHGDWCLREARKKGMTLCYNADEPLLCITDRMLAEMVDLQIHLLGAGRISDALPGAAERYRLFDPMRPHRAPALLARLAASCLLEQQLDSPALAPEDFYR